MRRLLIGLLVVVAVLVAVDRIAAAIAENQISDRLAAAYGMRSKPAVTIAGFPFLTQVVTGHYGRIEVTAKQVSADGAVLRDLSARFTGVRAPLGRVLRHGLSGATAARASVTGLLGFTEVSQRLPQGLRLRPAGKRLMVTGAVRSQGARIPVSAIVMLGVAPSGIKVTPVDVKTGAGRALPASARRSIVVPLTGLPLRLRLSSVRVAPGGLQVGAFARDVQFAAGATQSAGGLPAHVAHPGEAE